MEAQINIGRCAMGTVYSVSRCDGRWSRWESEDGSIVIGDAVEEAGIPDVHQHVPLADYFADVAAGNY